MTRQEHLLSILSEECAEVVKRVCKIQRFGRYEKQPGQDLDNLARLQAEVFDTLAAIEMLQTESVLRPDGMREAIDGKKAKVEHFLEYSRECGTLEEEA